MNLALTTALLCTFSWSSVSGSEFHAVEVQPGEEVTLLCSNFTSFPSNVFWFKLADRLNISRISSMVSSDGNITYYDRFQNSRFSMTSNMTTLFLRIKHVDLSDSGLYFCGSRSDQKPVIVSATFLKVQGAFDMSVSKLMIGILGALVIFLALVITLLVVRIRKPQSAHNDEQNHQHGENLDSCDLNYAALSFRARAKHSRRSSSENQQGSDVVYAATR